MYMIIKLVEKVVVDVYNINVNNTKSEEVVKSMYKKPFINKIDKCFFMYALLMFNKRIGGNDELQDFCRKKRRF